jgi:hypothetical protein
MLRIKLPIFVASPNIHHRHMIEGYDVRGLKLTAQQLFAMTSN